MTEATESHTAAKSSAADVELLIRAYVAKTRGVDIEAVPASLDLELSGLSSAEVVSLAGELEELLGTRVCAGSLLEAESIRAAAQAVLSAK